MSSLFAQFGGGNGTANDPYLIATPTHLDNIRMHPNSCYRQIANIDMDLAPYNQGTGFNPIAYDNGFVHYFTGAYDGSEYSISNLFINLENYDDYPTGLFGVTDGASLNNIHLQNVNMVGASDVGGLVGICITTSIIGCSVTGTLYASDQLIHIAGCRAGGLVGRTTSGSQLHNCYSIGTVSGASGIGGLVGSNENTNITDCYSLAIVHCYMDGGGGLVGSNNDSDISQCYATGNIEGGALEMGGLIGRSYGTSLISNCYSKGSVESDWGGGLIGEVNSGNIINCYSVGQLISFYDWAGGLIYNSGQTSVDASYWNMITSGSEISSGGEGRTTDEMSFPYAENTYVGWDFTSIWSSDIECNINEGYPYFIDLIAPNIVSNPTFSYTAGYYDSSFQLTINCETPNAEIHYTNDGTNPDMDSPIYMDPIQIENSVTIKARAFQDDWLPSMTVSVSYGLNYFDGGVGTLESPYLIATADQLNHIREVNDKHYRQTASINLDVIPYNTGYGWLPIDNFTGSYDGNGYFISNLYINPDLNNTNINCSLGLFNLVAMAELNNVILTNVNVNGVNWVGGLAGEIWYSRVNNCSSTGSVNGFTCVGGLIGLINNQTTITNCNSLANITGHNESGGLGGEIRDNCSLHDCYSIGSLGTTPGFPSSSATGGLVGYDYDYINTFTNCYWNIETSGINVSAGGEGRTTDEMTFPYSENTYVGWDFDTTWHADLTGICNGYPYLNLNAVSSQDPITASNISLQNYPNPFNPTTTISFTLKTTNRANLCIYNIKGQLVKTLINDELSRGSHSCTWDGTDIHKNKVGSGLYFSRLVSDGRVQTRKMMLVK